MNFEQKVRTPKEMAQEYYEIVSGYTDYEIIEIEQVNPRMNRLEGAMVLHYTKQMDTTDPESPVIRGVTQNITGGTLTFIESPYPRKPVGTGRVAYLIADRNPTPVNSLSGEKLGWNEEFLASHYGDDIFVIVDEEWDKKIRARHEKIIANRESSGAVFDSKYAIRAEKEKTVPVRDDSSVMAEMDAMKDQMQKMQALLESNAKVMAEQAEKLAAAEPKPKRTRKKKVVAEEPVETPVEEPEASFAE